MTSVAIFGAGVAGLTAAHELAGRGFSVTLYEERKQIGGKSRTEYFSQLGSQYPGEHGFRFFPSFYRHVHPDTMARIPLDPAKADPLGWRNAYPQSVASNLIGIYMSGLAVDGKNILWLPRKQLNASDVLELAKVYFEEMQVPLQDSVQIAGKLLTYYSWGDKRRRECDLVTFWNFLGASSLSQKAQDALTRTPKSLVAMSAKEGNARTLANVLFLMMTAYSSPGPSERVLNAPTSESWLEIWYAWLGRLGVTCQTGALGGFDFDPAKGRITGARLTDGTTVQADHYVAAIPLERIIPLITPPMAAYCAELAKLVSIDLTKALRWMVGAQFFLLADEPVIDGHIAFTESEWALTGVSQAQFWSPGGDFATRYGHNQAKGVLSLIASEWFAKGRLFNKWARDCTKDEIRQELLEQVGKALTATGKPILDASNVAFWHLDDDLDLKPNDTIGENRSRLLIHPPGLLAKRPLAKSQISNLALAGDYVTGFTDLATMEGANEAGRRAANAVLDQSGFAAGDRVAVWDLLKQCEPQWLQSIKAFDDYLYDHLHEPIMKPLAEVPPLWKLQIQQRALMELGTRFNFMNLRADDVHRNFGPRED